MNRTCTCDATSSSGAHAGHCALTARLVPLVAMTAPAPFREQVNAEWRRLANIVEQAALKCDDPEKRDKGVRIAADLRALVE